MNTLVLNSNYSALGTVSWERAFVLIFEGKAEVVESYTDRVVRSISKSFKMPAVIRLMKWVKNKMVGIRFNKNNIYTRDKGQCAYCTDYVPFHKSTFDHVLPKSRGGKTNWDNIVLCCKDCNIRKDCRTPDEAKMPLKAKPGKPTFLPLEVNFTVRNRNNQLPDIWNQWLQK